jgi:predicted DNA-binding transcriptional regulator YafY
MATKKTARPRKPSGRPPVERHREVVRQWKLLKHLDELHYGKPLPELAADFEVNPRTIRRDMEALQWAGFPVHSQKVDGVVRWKLDKAMFRRLAEGLSLSELCALYASRTLAQFMAGTPFHGDLAAAFAKIEKTLPAKMKQYMNDIPHIFIAKAGPTKKPAPKQADSVASLYTAMIEQRSVRMRYYSFSSQKERDYHADPYRLGFAEGGLYLFAYVPAYGQLRIFAVERIRSVTLTDRHFNPVAAVGSDAFTASLGVNTGKPEPVAVRFHGVAAHHVVERQWHPSQQIEEQPDGSVVIRLRVCVDFALQAWILSFGPLAQVLEPRRLAERVYEQLEEARDQYAPRLFAPEPARRAPAHPSLPFRTARRS